MKPLLSIGIIFKNEIRCLERCLKSLEPLREEFPCELVMARCSGEWYLTLDADEWLGEDNRLLERFLRDNKRPELAAALTVRNYISAVGGTYTDFLGIRLLRMSTGLRYTGAIHERWEFPDGRMLVVFHAQQWERRRERKTGAEYAHAAKRAPGIPGGHAAADPVHRELRPAL